MATRRCRIKGIANIPLRKKTVNEHEKDVTEPPLLTEDNLKYQTEPSENSSVNCTENDSHVKSTTGLTHVQSEVSETEHQTVNTIERDIQQIENVVPVLAQKETQEKSSIIMRRKHLKPIVSASVINKTSKPHSEEANLEKSNTTTTDTLPAHVKEVEIISNLGEYLSFTNKNAIGLKDTPQEDLQVPTLEENNQTLQIVCDNSIKQQPESLALVQRETDVKDNENSFKQDNTHAPLPAIKSEFVTPNISVIAIHKIPPKTPEVESPQHEKKSLINNNPDIIANEHIIPTFLKPVSETSEYQKQNGRQNKPRTDKKNPTDLKEENQMTLNEICLTYHDDLPLVASVENSCLKKPITIVTGNQSDIEYPPPPPSPSKINRSRIKAIPKLNYRKTSFSASESEDETRKSNSRIRNDSVCSTASGIMDSVLESTNVQKSREINSIIQKKCTRSDQTRKLAEARREFQRRFGNNKPDRQRLTMMDLIFYNPETNPIIKDKSKVKPENLEEDVVVQEEENIEHEKVDDLVTDNNNKASSDEDNDIPGPQVKIGPSGEIILDEKSLVIERKELNKKKEELQKSEVVNGDFDMSYGIYKKQKRSKSWTSSETLRFYKALNSIGTDFALMCELFPNRTRREIKMKFKKEERINRTLIDKALMQPCSFDYEELKHEMDMEQKENEELERQKEENKRLRRQTKLEKPRKRKSTEQIKEEFVPPKKPKQRTREKAKQKDKINFENLVNENDADESDVQTQSESDDELIVYQRPTRSGRVPKVPDKYQAEEPPPLSSVICGIKKVKSSETDILNQNDKEEIKPGSIMIMCEKGENDQPVYKIFMVTPEQGTAPVKLAPDAIARAIKFKTGMAAKNILTISATSTDDEEDSKDMLTTENNITIPADETVTTLRNFSITDDRIELNERLLNEQNFTIVEDNNESTIRNYPSVADKVELKEHLLSQNNIIVEGDGTTTISQSSSVVIVKSDGVLQNSKTNLNITNDKFSFYLSDGVSEQNNSGKLERSRDGHLVTFPLIENDSSMLLDDKIVLPDQGVLEVD